MLGQCLTVKRISCDADELLNIVTLFLCHVLAASPPCIIHKSTLHVNHGLWLSFSNETSAYPIY